jgi:hypothetical protein
MDAGCCQAPHELSGPCQALASNLDTPGLSSGGLLPPRRASAEHDVRQVRGACLPRLEGDHERGAPAWWRRGLATGDAGAERRAACRNDLDREATVACWPEDDSPGAHQSAQASWSQGQYPGEGAAAHQEHGNGEEVCGDGHDGMIARRRPNGCCAAHIGTPGVSARQNPERPGHQNGGDRSGRRQEIWGRHRATGHAADRRSW